MELSRLWITQEALAAVEELFEESDLVVVDFESLDEVDEVEVDDEVLLPDEERLSVR